MLQINWTVLPVGAKDILLAATYTFCTVLVSIRAKDTIFTTEIWVVQSVRAKYVFPNDKSVHSSFSFERKMNYLKLYFTKLSIFSIGVPLQCGVPLLLNKSISLTVPGTKTSSAVHTSDLPNREAVVLFRCCTWYFLVEQHANMLMQL